MFARDLGPERAVRDLLSTGPQIEEITARGPPDKILTSRLTDDVPFRTEREDAESLILCACDPADGACVITRPVFFSSARSAPVLCARLLHAFGIALSATYRRSLKSSCGIGK